MVAAAGRSSAGRAAPGDRDALRRREEHPRDRGRRSTDRKAPSSSCSCGPWRTCASTWRAAMADEALVDRLDQTIDLLLARRDATAALKDPELAPLAVLAAELRHVPSTAFRARLRAHLTRRTTMTTLVLEATKIREGLHDGDTVCPRAGSRTPRLPDGGLRREGDVQHQGRRRRRAPGGPRRRLDADDWRGRRRRSGCRSHRRRFMSTCPMPTRRSSERSRRAARRWAIPRIGRTANARVSSRTPSATTGTSPQPSARPTCRKAGGRSRRSCIREACPRISIS